MCICVSQIIAHFKVNSMWLNNKKEKSVCELREAPANFETFILGDSRQISAQK